MVGSFLSGQWTHRVGWGFQGKVTGDTRSHRPRVGGLSILFTLSTWGRTLRDRFPRLLMIGCIGWFAGGGSAQEPLLQPVGLLATVGGVIGPVAIAGDQVVLGVDTRLLVLDASDPDHPRVTAQEEFPITIRSITTADGKLYLTHDDGTFRIMDWSDPARPRELSSLQIEEGIAVATAVSGTRVCVACGWAGLKVIDATGSTTPVVIGQYATPGEAWDVALAGDLAYVAQGLEGLLILDISDPSHPNRVGALDTEGDSRAVALNDALITVADGWHGLLVVDAADPARPTLVRRYADDVGYARDVAMNGDLAYVAAEIDDNHRLLILDLADPARPYLRAVAEMQAAADAVAVNGALAGVVDREWGLHLLDVTDPANPVARAAMTCPVKRWPWRSKTTGLLWPMATLD